MLLSSPYLLFSSRQFNMDDAGNLCVIDSSHNPSHPLMLGSPVLGN